MERVKVGCAAKTEEERHDCNGGDGCCIYDLVVRENYCDKGSHRESSLFHQPNHRNHWKKVEREIRIRGM